jgi:hypothetical protein
MNTMNTISATGNIAIDAEKDGFVGGRGGRAECAMPRPTEAG